MKSTPLPRRSSASLAADHGLDLLGSLLARTGTALSERTLGLVGMGDAGRALARRLRGTRGRRIYAAPRPLSAKTELDLGLHRLSIETVLRLSDALILTSPPDEFRIDAALLRRLPAGTVIVDLSDGTAVDAASIGQARLSGELAGFATCGGRNSWA